MKSILASGLALALMTGAVLAQTAVPAPAGAPRAAPPPAAQPGDVADAGAMTPPPPPPPGGPRAGRPMPGGPGDDAGPEGPRGRRPPPPPPGARIHLQRGDLVVDVQCREADPMASCSDAALQMLDHLQAAAKAQ